MVNPIRRSRLSKLARVLLPLAMVTGIGVSATNAIAKGDFTPKASMSTTNGILTLTMESTTGQFSISTGASHPHPIQTVFFPVGTGFTTFRDATSLQMFVNCSTPSPGLAGYTSVSMCTTAPVTTSTTNGFRTTFTIPNWTLVQDLTINGTTLSDTNVSETLTVTNTSAAPRLFGVRYMWDWQIAGNDGSFFRQRSPDGSFTGTPTTFNAPGFALYEEVDNVANPTFSVFATIGGGSLNPPPTTPDQFRYSNWPSSVGSAWDYTDPGSTGDSSVSYFWGFATPRTLAAGASASFTEYVTTQLSAVGPPAPPPAIVAVPTPTLSQWSLLILAGLLVAFGARMLYLRRS
jgi:IPTL-CTERM motif